MSIELEVNLTPPKTSVALGEMVRGLVHVRVEKTCPCKALRAELWWNASLGSTTRVLEGPVLFSGEWEPGVYEYPFALEVPEGPPTFNGAVFDLQWRVMARADIPWNIDPIAEKKFTTRLPYRQPRTSEEIGRAHLMDVRAVAHPSTQESDPFVFIAPLIISAALGVINCGLGIRGDSLCFFSSTFFTAIAIAIGVRLALTLKKRPPLRDIQIGITPELPYPGDMIAPEIAFFAVKDIKIQRITCVLYAKEEHRERIVPNNVGTRSRVEAHLSGPRTLLAGEDLQVFGTVRLPFNAPSSIDAGDCQLIWRASFHVEIEGHEDVVEQIKFPMGNKNTHHGEWGAS